MLIGIFIVVLPFTPVFKNLVISLDYYGVKSILDLPVGFSRVYLFALRRSFQKYNLNKYIIHIPHASLEVPKSFKNKLTINYSEFQKVV